MDQDCRRTLIIGGLNQVVLPRAKNSGKSACFQPKFSVQTENLPVVEVGGTLCF